MLFGEALKGSNDMTKMGNTKYAEISFRASPSRSDRATSQRFFGQWFMPWYLLRSADMEVTDKLFYSRERVEGFRGTVRYAASTYHRRVLCVPKSIPT